MYTRYNLTSDGCGYVLNNHCTIIIIYTVLEHSGENTAI